MDNVFVLLQLTDKLSIAWGTDLLAGAFALLVTVMWITVAVFAVKYAEHLEDRPRFWLFYVLTYIMLISLAFAENYLTMYLSFEFMALLSMPLVLHEGTPEAIAGAKKYLFYSVFGATLGLMGFIFMGVYGTTLSFVPGGALDPAKLAGHEELLRSIAFLAIVGFGAKAGMFPLHAWLPTAHPVAPAPVSALLSGVITKSGVLCIIRVLFYQFGRSFLEGSWVQIALTVLALITIVLGSTMAYTENVLKKRFAYSTVSQVSYVLFGVFTMNSAAMTGALLHALYHSILKDTLFLSAGSIIFNTHKTRVEDLQGMGRKLPFTFGALTIASLGLVGIPPFAGFLSKWYLAQGSLSEGIPVFSWLGPAVLLLSALLTAGYLFPIVIDGFFKPSQGEDGASGHGEHKAERIKESPLMWVPLVFLALMAVVTGVFAQPIVDFFTEIVSALG